VTYKHPCHGVEASATHFIWTHEIHIASSFQVTPSNLIIKKNVMACYLLHMHLYSHAFPGFLWKNSFETEVGKVKQEPVGVKSFCWEEFEDVES